MGPTIILGLLLAASPLSAQITDDRHFGLPPSPEIERALREEASSKNGAPFFFAESAPQLSRQKNRNPGQLSGILHLTDREGRLIPAARVKVLRAIGEEIFAQTQTLPDGSWSLPKGDGDLRLELTNRFWSIYNPENNRPYQWEISTGSYKLNTASENGKIGLIHLQFLKAFSVLEKTGDVSQWWKTYLKVIYPGSANFFMRFNFSLNLTRAHAWDVNLHEFGHAVSAVGTRSWGGGGSHRIVECYTTGLAWEEGFATFFAGAVGLDPSAPDPRFEFLVERIGPLPIETLPSDVCRGPTNEWRVAAGLWDLYDNHNEKEDRASLSFERMWSLIRGRLINSIQDVDGFMELALPPEQYAAAHATLVQNTLFDGTSVREGLKRTHQMLERVGPQ